MTVVSSDNHINQTLQIITKYIHVYIINSLWPDNPNLLDADDELLISLGEIDAQKAVKQNTPAQLSLVQSGVHNFLAWYFQILPTLDDALELLTMLDKTGCISVSDNRL